MATTGDKRRAKPQAYSFVRQKIPRGFSYPLKRSELDLVLEQRALPDIESGVFYFRRNPESIFRVDYTGEQSKGIVKPGTFEIWIYAVESRSRASASENLMRSVIAPACDWILALHQAGNVRRLQNHHFVARRLGDDVLIEKD